MCRSEGQIEEIIHEGVWLKKPRRENGREDGEVDYMNDDAKKDEREKRERER